MLRTALLVIAAVKADIVDDAVNTNAVDSFGEPNTIMGMTQMPAEAPAAPVLAEAAKAPAASSSSSFYGSSFVTPALTPYALREGQRPAKIGYKVPNFGIDHDIIATQKHERDTSKKLKTPWNPKKDKDDKWIVPTESAFFKI